MLWRSVVSLGAAAAMLSPLGCYSVSRHDTDGDADGDADADLTRCDEDVECEGAGLTADYPIVIDAEVVEIDGDQAVLLGSDGLPLEYSACGLTLSGALTAGMAVEVTHFEPEAWGECWVTVIEGEEGPLAAVSRCEAEGAVAPPLDEIGWGSRLVPACEGFVDGVCPSAGGALHLDVPITVNDLEVTAVSGAQATVPLGATEALGDFEVRVLAASVTEAVDDEACFLPATGHTAISLVRRAARTPCAAVPEVDRSLLGLSVAADETIRELQVLEVFEDRVLLVSDEGAEVDFGFWGPDPRRSLSAGQVVTARRYPREVTGTGLLDVLIADGVPVLATIATDAFSLELPDLTALGLELELGEACVYEEGASACSGEVLFASRYPVRVTNDRGGTGTVEVGSTELIGSQLFTLLDASQHPGVVCPDYHVEAWGPFGLTIMQEYL